MLKVFSASSDGVVASIGTSNFCTEASDSPSLVRRLEATLPKAFTASSLLDPAACSLASVSPQLVLWPAYPRCHNPPPPSPPCTRCPSGKLNLPVGPCSPYADRFPAPPPV